MLVRPGVAEAPDQYGGDHDARAVSGGRKFQTTKWEDQMHDRPVSVMACAGLVAAGLVLAVEMQAQGQPAPATPTPVAPPDTAELRAQYERWRTEFKTWGKWAPVGQESKGTTNLITPEKVASAMRLAKDGIVVSLAHAEPQVAAADVAAAGLFRRTTNNITDVGTTDNYQVSYHGQTVA